MIMHSPIYYCYSISVFLFFILQIQQTTSNCIPPNVRYVVELVWAFNRASEAEYLRYSREIQNSYMPLLFNTINAQFPGSKFGLMHFNGRAEQPCLEIKHPLTANIEDVSRQMKSTVLTTGGGTPEKSLAASYFLASSPLVGWTRTLFTKENHRVIKIIVLTGDDISFPSVNSMVLAGDAQCQNVSYISPSTLGAQLRSNDIAFIGMISGPHLAAWKIYFREMNCKGKVVELDLKNTQAVVDAVVESVTDVICHDEVSTTSTTTSTSTTVISTLLSTHTIESDNNGSGVLFAAGGGVVAALAATAGAGMYLSKRHMPQGESIDGFFESDAKQNVEMDKDTIATTEATAYE